jgi:hypothetical protein
LIIKIFFILNFFITDINRTKIEYEDQLKELGKPHEDILKDIEKFKIREKTKAAKTLLQMNLICDNEGFIYFNELLYYVMRYSL